ncbi:MAG: hypothetical protein AAFY31_12530 [Pseudomonadota bacterium]
MKLEYKAETNLRIRVLFALLLLFVSLIATALISFFGLFGGGAYELITSVIGGDMTRLGDFLGYLAALVIVLGCSGALLSGLVFHAFFETNHVAEIDPQSRTVVVKYYSPWPWHRPRSSAYQFDEVGGLKLIYDDEQSRVLLYLPDRKRPLTLFVERRWHVAQQKFHRLKETGLPSS